MIMFCREQLILRLDELYALSVIVSPSLYLAAVRTPAQTEAAFNSR